MTQTREENYAGVFDGRVGFGRRPALILVDFVNAYVTPGAPLYAEGVVRAVAASVPLLAAAREAGIPVVFTKVLYHPGGLDGGLFLRKVPALRALVPGAPLAEIVEALRPLPEEVVIAKQYPSPFFATPLAPMLTALGVDTVILAGCSTSGCIRAGAVDGLQHGFRVIVPRECVGDRHDAPHEANLFDIQAKYGDVLPRAEVIARLRGG
ncbi:MAG: isochorismatase family protein [Roseococcus sp.]